MWQHYLNLLGVQQRTCSTPGQLFLLERGSEPSTHAHLALDQLVVPLYLEYIAHLAAHGTLGTVVAVTARAVERSVLHSQLWAIGGFTCKVHTALLSRAVGLPVTLSSCQRGETYSPAEQR